MNSTGQHRVVVLGGGYAGIMAANRLSKSAEVTLVNPRPQFVHRIRLHQWIAGTGEAEADFERVLNKRVRLLVDTATRIDAAARKIQLFSGEWLTYDYLIYAVGSTGTPAERIPGLRDHGFVLGEWEAAQRLRDHLADFDAESDPVTVIGGGLTGLEMSSELAEAGRSVRLISGEIAPSFGAEAREVARRRLADLGVEVVEDVRVRAVGAGTITIDGPEGVRTLPSAVTIAAAGFGVPDLADVSGLTTDDLGRLITDETLTSVDDPYIVGTGDAVAPSGVPFRMSCQAANQLGPHAAETVLDRMAGSAPAPVIVKFLGQCVSLGRSAAVVQLTDRDDNPTGRTVRGRRAARFKELVCRSVIWGLRAERRRPGLIPSMPGEPRAVSATGAPRVSTLDVVR